MCSTCCSGAQQCQHVKCRRQQLYCHVHAGLGWKTHHHKCMVQYDNNGCFGGNFNAEVFESSTPRWSRVLDFGPHGRYGGWASHSWALHMVHSKMPEWQNCTWKDTGHVILVVHRSHQWGTTARPMCRIHKHVVNSFGPCTNNREPSTWYNPMDQHHDRW